jgi:hypothetical protein
MFPYVIVAKMRTCCIFLRNILKLLYHRKKLSESVFTGKLFFSKSQLQLTQQDEFYEYDELH